ncbi:C2 domain-containing protein/PRT_C domain-containing protein [Cephalotus follicularis]|uniref:C2 domain-containing protein/PRT_C domain-containing protein n=1 Tax=Cephalotus follicularis TaxID=3775 RepID=A0A1Q3C217_CEPFO|nr:C2 domain-containing protein/PRT_C domain-containing protein [Cephalotus follicularis]
MNNLTTTTKEKLVVEVIAAHNLMPKDGEGSSSPFVEVEFENQTFTTQVKYKDLNPVWNEKLVFHIQDVADLPYRTIEVNVFNERRSGSSRNFLGKVRVSGSSIAKEGEEVIPHLYTLDKRSLFSHIRGEITLKLYVSTRDKVKEVVGGFNNAALSIAGSGSNNPGFSSKKNKKLQQQQSQAMALQQHHQQMDHDNKQNQQQNHNHAKVPVEPNPGELKPVIITSGHGPPIAGVGGGGVYLNGSSEFSLKETSPHLGGGPLNKDKTSSTYDLVEQMQYLYVKVVKAKDIALFGSGEIVAEVKLGNYRGVTKRVSVNRPDWDQVFAFSKDCIQSSMVEIFVKEGNKEDFLGRVWFDLNEVPRRVPPDSQLAPQWYRMEDKKGDKSKTGEVMVSIWFGTQADEAFAEAWHSKAANVHIDGLCSIKSKVYLSPKLWYLRVSVIEAQDVIPGEKGSAMMRFPELSAKVQVGNQVLRTRISGANANRSLSNPYWNEDMLFVVAEPFEDYLLVSVEDRIGPGRDAVVGRVLLPVSAIERRTDEKSVVSRWFNLDNHFGDSAESKLLTRFGSRIHLRASLDGGYHVLDEATMYSSEFRPTAKQLWRPHIGVLEMGILGASWLIPTKIKEGKGGSTDAYCVAKYGQKWVRTRTVVDSLSPKWNEQYTWEVFDPCTVITIGVFDNCRIDKTALSNGGSRDSRIGKVRIRLSTLESDRVYTHSYPLLMLHTTGVKKMGELHLAVRFSCANMVNMLHMYTMPLLPKMHYVHPLSVNQLESLRYQAMNVVASRLSRAEPPLGREVVEYMLDHDSHMWSMRRSKANFFRLMNVISGLVAMGRRVESMRNWHKPVYSTLFVAIFLWLIAFPELIISSVLLYMSFLGIWRYRSRPSHPSHMDTRLSHAECVYPDELDEEFDSFPTSRSTDIVRMRYDRLRSVAGRIQTVVGDMATQGERFQALISWRDPRATFLFVVLCPIVAIGFYVVPFRVVLALWGLYVLRPPRFRSKLPSRVLSFFRRLPAKSDSLL